MTLLCSLPTNVIIYMLLFFNLNYPMAFILKFFLLTVLCLVQGKIEHTMAEKVFIKAGESQGRVLSNMVF